MKIKATDAELDALFEILVMANMAIDERMDAAKGEDGMANTDPDFFAKLGARKAHIHNTHVAVEAARRVNRQADK